ncbi:MAG: methyltransferase domain-containing protein [Candidatus Levybacteria bacterium]|nr:methyltransferase domain-containing protein [Candidatus Levybacteria bacterium]
MDKTQLPTNYIKHTSKNPLQKYLIDNFYSSLVSLIKPLNPKTVLDAGCGEGFTMNNLIKNNIGENVEGIEFSEETITIGKKLFPDLKIKRGSIYSIPYPNNFFDLVVCTEVLEHLDSPQRALKEILRISTKDVVISVPNEPFFMLSNFLRGKNISRLGNDPGHINHWTIISFINLLKKHGLKIKKIKLPFPWIIILGEKNEKN